MRHHRSGNKEILLLLLLVCCVIARARGFLVHIHCNFPERGQRHKSSSSTYWRANIWQESHSSSFNGVGHEVAAALAFVDSVLDESVGFSDETILQNVKDLHEKDCQTASDSSLEIEDVHLSSRIIESPLSYEWMSNQVAIQSTELLVSPEDINKIRSAAEEVWEQQSSESSSTSRFTYQYSGNSEAHVSDFSDPKAVDVINRMLAQKVYPWVRSVFLSGLKKSGHEDTPVVSSESPLFVYDALYIRYNATAAESKMAGQPLHRDLGLVSINIMLNEGFEGGGTYFENQGMGDGSPPLQPLKPQQGPGHALAHYSYERHAGAGTSGGVRDILVCFISTKHLVPRLRNARLKQSRPLCEQLFSYGNSSDSSSRDALLCRIRHQRLALVDVPTDGEAFQYLGSALLDWAQLDPPLLSDTTTTAANVETILGHAMQLLQEARYRTPGDARVHNNLGIVLARLENLQQDKESFRQSNVVPSAQSIYQEGLDRLDQASMAGCNVDDERLLLTLNYGLCLSRKDLFAEACQVLGHSASKWKDRDTTTTASSSDHPALENSHRLWAFCMAEQERASIGRQS